MQRIAAVLSLVGLIIGIAVAADSGANKNQKKDPPAKTGKDLLAKARPFVKNWKMTDLVPDEEKGLDGLENRSFERGKKLFTEINCILCHSYGDRGGFSGPNLTEVGARYGPVDVLSSIIEPSKVIADAYMQKVVVMDDGRIFTGMVVYMDNDIQITPDVLDPDRKITVSLDKVDSIENSDISPMPEGLIVTLTREEILDLVAFVICRDDPQNEMFAAPPKKK